MFLNALSLLEALKLAAFSKVKLWYVVKAFNSILNLRVFCLQESTCMGLDRR